MNDTKNSKVYIRLSVEKRAFHSGREYEEEVFLPEEVWKEIEGTIDRQVHLGELDGKHSEVRGELDVMPFHAEELESYIPLGNDGERLFEHIYEYLDPAKYDNSYLLNIQEEVAALGKAESLTIKIRSDKKEEVLALLKDYLL